MSTTYSNHYIKNGFDIKGLTGSNLEEKLIKWKSTNNYISKTFSYSLTYSYHSLTHSYSYTNISNSGTYSFLGKMFSKNMTQSYPLNIGTHSNKFYTKVNHNIPKLDNQSLSNIINIINPTNLNFNQLLQDSLITINGIIVKDSNYQLKSLDIIRVGMEGHFINNNNGIAIIK